MLLITGWHIDMHRYAQWRSCVSIDKNSSRYRNCCTGYSAAQASQVRSWLLHEDDKLPFGTHLEPICAEQFGASKRLLLCQSWQVFCQAWPIGIYWHDLPCRSCVGSVMTCTRHWWQEWRSALTQLKGTNLMFLYVFHMRRRTLLYSVYSHKKKLRTENCSSASLMWCWGRQLPKTHSSLCVLEITRSSPVTIPVELSLAGWFFHIVFFVPV